MAKNIRADQLLVARHLADTPARAQALILSGSVYSGEQRIEKSGDMLRPDVVLEVRGKPHPWVSRGGLKLDHGLTRFGWDIRDTVVIDVGASTGGFTDVALTRGAVRVYAVDVGHGQLAWKLQTDSRVIMLDKTNARHLTRDQIPEKIDLIVCDASFISLTSILPAVLSLTKPQARLLALIKPQFEASKEQIGKGGIVRDASAHDDICRGISDWLNEQAGWRVIGITPSPITGPDGNVEFLIAAEKKPA